MGWIKYREHHNSNMVRTNHECRSIWSLEHGMHMNEQASQNIVEKTQGNTELRHHQNQISLTLFAALLHGVMGERKSKIKNNNNSNIDTHTHIKIRTSNNERNVYLWMHSILLIVEVQ